MVKRSKSETVAPRKAKIKGGQLEVMLAAHEFLAKRHGSGVVLAMDDPLAIAPPPGWISTQSLAVDTLIGNGGLPQARVVEFFGPEGAGKSTLADHVLAEVQRVGGQGYLWDTEHARDPKYVDKMGIVRSRASKIDADTMEAGFEVMVDILEWHLAHHPLVPGVLVWDTVAGVPTANEADPDETSERFGPAKIIRGSLRKLVQVLKRSRWILLAVNQEYEGGGHGGQSIRKTYGGGGFPYFATTRLSIWPAGKIWGVGGKDSGRPPIGQMISVRSVKNKVYPPLAIAKGAIIYGQGVDNTWTIQDTLSSAGMIKSAGGWYSLDWPEVAGKYRKWQSGFLGLNELCAECPELWGILLEAYKAVMQTVMP
jgi:recombination protein RecA